MPLNVTPVAALAIVLSLLTAAPGIAWQKKPLAAGRNNSLQRHDTLPEKKELKEEETRINGDLDEAIENVKKAQEALEKQQQSGQWKKMQQDVLKAQQELQSVRLHEQMEKALKSIDLQKMQVEQLKNLDARKIQGEIDAALQQTNWNKMQQELQQLQLEQGKRQDFKKMEREIRHSMEASRQAIAQLKDIDMEKMEKDLEKARDELVATQGRMQEEMERARKEINENQHQHIAQQMEKAREDILRARVSLEGYRAMVQEMEHEGLLQEKGPYDIEYKNGDLFLNGNKQSSVVTDKYRHYFKKDHVRLKKEKDASKTIHL